MAEAFVSYLTFSIMETPVILGTSDTRVQAPYPTEEFICFAFELHITKMIREKPLPYILQYLDS